MENWQIFLLPYEQAVKEMKVKLRNIRQQFIETSQNTPIEFVTGRVKSKESILAKCELRKIPCDRIEQEMQDIAGLRITCQFVRDIYDVAAIIRDRHDMTVIQERDYIQQKKESGYRSYHMVVSYPLQLTTGEKNVLVEIQIRTLAMNFWATIEHSLHYKYNGAYPEEITQRLQRAAEAAYQLDEEMSLISEEIQDAQLFFSHEKWQAYNGDPLSERDDAL